MRYKLMYLPNKGRRTTVKEYFERIKKMDGMVEKKWQEMG